MVVHEKPNLRWDALTPTITTTTLATAVVALRLIVRCKFVKAVGFDDFVIMVSLVSILPLLREVEAINATAVSFVKGFGASILSAYHFPSTNPHHLPSALTPHDGRNLPTCSSSPGSSLALPWPWS
jgi:hypothetical protein